MTDQEKIHELEFRLAVCLCGGYTGLARRLGISLSTVHGWKRRKRVPSWRVEKIASIANEDHSAL